MSSLQPAAETRQQCRHILPAGRRCLAPCLRTRDFCFFHQTSRPPRRPRALTHPDAFRIPRPEDRASIQLALGDILERLAAAELDPRRARLMLYALQIASHNLPNPIPASLDPDSTFVHEIAEHPTHGPIALEAPYTPPPSDPEALHHQQRIFEQTLREEWARIPPPLTPNPVPTTPLNLPEPEPDPAAEALANELYQQSIRSLTLNLHAAAETLVDRDLPQQVEIRQHLPRPQHHAGQWIIRHAHRQPRLLPNPLIQILDQRAATRQHDPTI